jgi:DNA mismatch repair protein MutS
MNELYEDFYKKYSEVYGNKTVIFLQVGSFYELYDTLNTNTNETVCNIREIGSLLGIQITTKSSDLGEGKKLLFGGVPEDSLHKWAGQLTDNGYTVVVVSQTTPENGSTKKRERQVSRILSPGTHIEHISGYDIPYIVSLYFHAMGTITNTPHFGASAIDLTTGMTTTYSGTATGHFDVWTADDLVQYVSVHSPKEMIINWYTNDYNIPDETFFRRMFGLPTSVKIHIRIKTTNNAFSRPSYVSEYLQKSYSIQNMLIPRIYLGLRTDQEELALLYLLEFIEEHFLSALQALRKNIPWQPEQQLICGNHALYQLQIIGTNISESVVGLFQKTLTQMGRRGIRERIIKPLCNSNMIETNLSQVDEYMKLTDASRLFFEKQLQYMADIPRLHRRLLCATIKPDEIVALHQTYSSITKILEKIEQELPSLSPEMFQFSSEDFHFYINAFYTHFDAEKALICSSNEFADVSPFSDFMYSDIKRIEDDIQSIRNDLEELRKSIELFGELSNGTLKLEIKDKGVYGIKTSPNALTVLQKIMKLQQQKVLDAQFLKGIHFTALKTSAWIECDELHELNRKLLKKRDELYVHIQSAILDSCNSITQSGKDIWQKMEEWITTLDCTQCICKISQKHGFTRPSIVNNTVQQTSSSFHIKGLRHPLVELSNMRTEYVLHDVSLTDETLGWLVYGMNASGKSTLMKAVGISIILAQAGCYVPCQQMTLAPFNSLYTRILNQDNIFAGLSSFAVEMSELRDILRNVNDRSLVLGDELCAGTETVSAQALVTAGIQWLSKANAKFIFATHLHDIPKMIDTSALKMCIWHLHVEYNPITHRLIYDRSLRPGSGSTMYGLEVARAMDLPQEFIEQAIQNRHKIIGSVSSQNAKSTPWNVNIACKNCEICGINITKELEVHHIRPRKNANNDGHFEDGQYMNHERNLVVLCQKCHDDIDRGTLQIQQRMMTSSGPVLQVEKSDNKQLQRNSQCSVSSKTSDPNSLPQTNYTQTATYASDISDIDVIKKLIQKYPNAKLSMIQFQLTTKYGIDMSDGKLRQIIKKLKSDERTNTVELDI